MNKHDKDIVGAGLFGFVLAIPVILLVSVFIF